MWGFNADPVAPSLVCSLDEHSPTCGMWPDDSVGSPAVRQLDFKDWLSGAPTYEVSCATECILPLGRKRLSVSPTIAGQAVYIAVQLRVVYANSHAYNGMCVAVLLQIHDGVAWQTSSNNTYTAAAGSTEAVSNGDWRVHTFMAEIGWNATHDEALFQLRFGGGHRVDLAANATIHVGKVAIAPVGYPSP